MDAFQILTILISLGSIVANIAVARGTIRINKELAKENAGKNRVIYSVEEMCVDGFDNLKRLNDRLNSEDYTILTVSTNFGNFSQRIYSLGKIKI